MIGLSQLSISLGSQVVGDASPSISAGLSYTRGDPDEFTISLSSVNPIDPFAALSVSQMTLDGTDVIGDLDDAAVSPELATNTAPGALTNNQSVSAITGTIESGALYLLAYTIDEGSSITNMFPGSGSPIESQASDPLPTSAGTHSRLVYTDSTETGRVITISGSGTISALTFKKAEWGYTVPENSGDEQITYRIAHGDAVTNGSFYVPGTTLYVSNTGSDTTGTGASLSPFATPAAASAATLPGDIVKFRTGTYPAAFDVSNSGTRGNPITYTPDDGHTPVFVGELQSHIAQGGSNLSSLPTDQRDGIRIDSKDWIIIDGLTIEWVWRHGIFVVGTEGEQHGHHIIRNNVIRNVGRGGVFVGGNNSDSVIPSGEITNLRTVDVLIDSNDVTQTNLEIDQQGFGNVECVAAASSVSSIVTRLNNIYSSRQYGIDYKAGVNGSYTPVSGDVNFTYGPGNFIEDNTVTDTERHGIYIDAGHRFCEDITIRRNVVNGCRHGIVLSRENGDPANTFLSLDTIGIFNNLIIDVDQIGIYFHRHSGDADSGTISNIRCRFNTVVNANREGGFKDINIDGWPTEFTTATMTGNDFSGNLVYSDQQMDMAVDLSASGWTMADNFNVQDGVSTGVDPLFVDAANGDYELQETSPAINYVSGLSSAPFNVGYNGTSRPSTTNAGAFADPVVSTVFSVSLDEGTGELQITNNDGSDFTIDDAADNYDGTYSITVGSLASGPIALVAPVLAGDGSPEAGETLTITPALFAYDGDLGAMTVAYTTTGTNSVNVTDPSNPTLLIDAADAGTSITVTATATQGANDTVSVSNSLAIPSAMSAERLALVASSVLGTDVTFNIDLSGAANGDRLAFVYGTMSATEPTITVDGVAVPANAGNSGNQGPGGRLWVYDMPMTGAGSATALVDIDSGNSSGHIIAAVLVKGATLDAVDVSYNGGSDVTHDNSVTASASPNLVVAVALGRSDYFTSYSWAGAVEQGSSAPVLGSRSGSIAIATDVVAGPYQVGFTTGADAETNSETGIALMAYS
ncbi:MAG: right-handed parallel beta-helix repeat-containing protein [Roseobacter sp.]